MLEYLLITFAALVFAHFLFDFPLQGSYLASAKNRVTNPDEWQIPLFAHGVLHAFPVYIILNVWWLAVAELVSHMVIDDFKCRGEITFKTDQFIHLALKAVWVILAVLFT